MNKIKHKRKITRAKRATMSSIYLKKELMIICRKNPFDHVKSDAALTVPEVTLLTYSSEGSTFFDFFSEFLN